MKINLLKLKIVHILPLMVIAVLALFGIVATTTFRSEQAEAATQLKSWNDCVNGSGAPSVSAIQAACTQCWQNTSDGLSGVGRGALWFNGYASNRDSNVVVAHNATDSVDIYLWGQWFSCTQASVGKNTAQYIWFAEAGQMNGNSTTGYLPNAVSFITPNNAAASLYRGQGTGQTHVWFPGSNNLKLKLDVAKFKQYATNKGGCSGSDAEGWRCEADVSVNRCPNRSLGGYIFYPNRGKNQNCYGDDSKIVLIIDPQEPDLPDNPPDEPDPVENAGRVRFWSQSAVFSNERGDFKHHELATREKESYSKATLKMSTNQENVTVGWWHKLNYAIEDINGNTPKPLKSNDVFPNDICTNYEVFRMGSKLSQTTVKQMSKYCATRNLTGSQEVSRTHSYNVHLDPGETVTVCEKIQYQPGTVYLKIIEHLRQVPVYETTGTNQGLPLYSMGQVYDQYAEGNTRITAITTDGTTASFNSASVYHQAERQVPVRDWQGNPIYNWDGTVMTTTEYYEASGAGTPGTSIYTKDGSAIYQPRLIGAQTYSSKNGGKTYYRYNPETGGYVSSGAYHWGPVHKQNCDYGYCYEYDEWVVQSGAKEGEVPVDSEGNTLYEVEMREIHHYYEYVKDGEDFDGSSEACIEITRPEAITPEDPENGSDIGSQTGDGSNKPMYAGESSTMEWSWEAHAYPTRRIMEWRAVALQVKVNQQYDAIRNGAFSGNILANVRSHDGYNNNVLDPCQWYSQGNRRLDLRENRCELLDAEYWNSTNGLQEYREYKPIARYSVAVPDEVGDKYCTTSGLQWQYWYGEQYNDEETSWHEESVPRYWTNYGMACSTIAKKPSVSIVNGGFFTNGGVQTSVAPRYEEQLFATILGNVGTNNGMLNPGVDSSITATTFGSWSEYIANINRSAMMLGSGSSYAVKGASLSQLIKNSPLTIRNAKEGQTDLDQRDIGYSGVSATSAVQARLASYFNSNSATEGYELGGGASIGGSGWEGISDTRIVYVDGDVNITDNITLADNVVDTIYRLPQVVIYAKGNINISENVTRVDAWLIAGGDEGKVDTCTAWVDKETSARIANYSGDDKIKCDKQLIVNGPVFAKKLSATRAFGASRGLTNVDFDTNHTYTTDERANSGEIFNLGANTYLWAYAQAGRYNSSYTESYSRELPPRY